MDELLLYKFSNKQFCDKNTPRYYYSAYYNVTSNNVYTQHNSMLIIEYKQNTTANINDICYTDNQFVPPNLSKLNQNPISFSPSWAWSFRPNAKHP